MPRTTTILPDESKMLVLALVGSVLIHLLLLGVAGLGAKLSWWSPNVLPLWMRPISASAPAVKVPTLTQRTDEREAMPLVFVQVTTPSDEAPKDTKFYSSANSKAANPDIKIDSEMPNIDGKQTKLIRTEDVPREKAFPLQPAVTPQLEPKTTAPPQPKAAPKPGDLALAKPSDSPTVGDDINKRVGEPVRKAQERPRTISEAKARLNPLLSGEKMKQEGGVRNRAQITGLDVRGSQFGDYDARFIAAVQNRWFDLIDERRFAAAYQGTVVVKFRLTYEGRILDARIAEARVADDIMSILCQKAIQDPAPYDKWPEDMRRIIGGNYRELTFTFHYN